VLVGGIDCTVPANVGNKQKKDVIRGLWNQSVQREQNDKGTVGYTVVTFILVISQVLNVQCHGNAMETRKVSCVSQATENKH